MSAIRRCEHRIAQLAREICDLGEYVKTNNKKHDAPYKDFSRYRGMFIRRLLQETNPKVCFGGSIYILIPQVEEGSKPLPAVLARMPGNLNKCRGTKTYDVTVYQVGYTRYLLTKHQRKQYVSKAGGSVKAQTKFLETLLPPEAEQGSHATALLIDHTRQKAEYYDPNGSISDTKDAVSRALVPWLRRRYPTYALSDASELYSTCPRFGVQYISSDSRCQNWSLLHLYLRIYCPSIESRRLQTYLAKRGKTYLNRLMNGWMCFMWGYASDHGLITRYKQLLADERKAEAAASRYAKRNNPNHDKIAEAYRLVTRALHQQVEFMAGTLEE